jgi:hypothetical protein
MEEAAAVQANSFQQLEFRERYKLVDEFATLEKPRAPIP